MADDWWKAAIWSDIEGETYALTRDGQRLRLDKHQWSAVPPADPRDRDTQVDVFIPPQPAQRVFVQGRDSGGKMWLRVLDASERSFRDDGHSIATARIEAVRARPVAEILRDVALRAGEPSLAKREPGLGSAGEIEVVGIRQDGLSLAIRADTPHDRIWVVELDKGLRVTGVTCLMLPWHEPRSNTSAVVDANLPEARWLFVSADIERDSRKWSIWRLAEHQPATKLLEHAYMVNGDGDDAVAAGARRVLGEPGVDQTMAVAGGRLLVRLSNDSAYLVDLRSLDTTVAFHPGDEIIRARISAAGEIGFFIQGAFTAYVVQWAAPQ